MLATLKALGFVQLDSIQVVARAHDLVLHARLDGYKPSHLETLRARGQVFEAWTHDASLLPAECYPLWKRRFRRDGPRIQAHPWWRNLLGERSDEVCRQVLDRIRDEGPLGSADFEHPEKRGAWWDWKPQKAALDYLWRTGALAVTCREHFHKRYDLPERVLTDVHALGELEPEEHLDWFCTSAAQRLGVFTPKELAAFWGELEVTEARAWCQVALRTGRIVAVEVEPCLPGPPQPAFALADWENRLASLPAAPRRMRLLAPFDPILRDRARALHRFGFDYRFEAFTPEPQRQFGYYVLPLLDGDRLVGRLDPKFHRSRSILEIKGLWWEPGTVLDNRRIQRLRSAVERLARFLGARDIQAPPPL